jgi:uncharacterized protein (TIGR02246 family)
LGPAAGFILLAGAAQAAPPVTTADAVRHQVEQFAECWNRHDMKAFADLFAANAEFVNVVGLWWKGREDIFQAHKFTHATMFKSSRLTLLDTAVRSPQDGIAIARTRWRLEGHTAPDGSALPPRTGLLVTVLQRTGTGWLIIDAQNTDIVEGVLSRPQ